METPQVFPTTNIMNLNKAFIIGNLTRDPEIRTLPSGQSVTSFSLATNRMWNDKNGQRQTDTQFHNIVAFGKTADIAGQYLNKGSMAYIEGRIQNRSWEGQDGQKKYKTEIVAERLQLGPRKYNSDSQTGQNNQNSQTKNSKQPEENLDTIDYGDEDINPDEIPF